MRTLRVAKRTSAVVFALIAATAASAQDAGIPPLNCTIKPSQVVDVAPTSAGVAVTVPVKPGQLVQQGDLIVQLDAGILEMEAAIARQRAETRGGLSAAQARLDAAKQAEAMMERARAARAVSQERLNAARKETALAEAGLINEREIVALALQEAERIDMLIERTAIRAPAPGIIGEELISVGEAADQARVAQLFVIQPMRVEVFVPTALLPDFIAQEDHAIRVAGRPARHSVSLDYISPLADLSSDTVSVYFTLEDSEIRPGFRCQYAS